LIYSILLIRNISNVPKPLTIRRSGFGIHTLLAAVSDNVNLSMSIDALKKDTAISMID